MVARTLLLCLAISCYGTGVSADESTANLAALDISGIMAKLAAGPPGAAEEPEKEYPDFEEVTKDMEALKGLFILWHYPEGTKGKDPQKLLCQIPAGFLGQKFMLSTSFSGGGVFTGFPIDERVVQWEELGRQLVLVEPETQFVTNGDSTVDDVVRRTHPDRIRTAVPIVTKSPGGDPIINLGPLLKSSFADIGWMSWWGGGGGGINSSLSKWTKKKPFTDNVEIGVELAVSSRRPPGSYTRKLVHYSFWRLPSTGYTPRIADDRIGYFLTTNRDWSKPTDARDIFNRYIDRWPLTKRDPSLKLCEPKKPIVFYIEKTVPVRFRRAVRDGILEWNKAFEKVGFLNAVEVRQQTDDNEWKDLDPEDMRYSFFRWIVNGRGFAMGPHRANPFTGEIYDADIIFDDAMVRYFEQSAQQMLPSTAVAMKMKDPALRAFLEKFPQWKRPTHEWENFSFCKHEENDENHADKLDEALRQRMHERGHHCCDRSRGMRHQMAVAGAVLAGQPKEVTERFLYDAIKDTVMHEVGHTLGLRHNFKASSIYSLEEIKKRRITGEATTGSVMDYNPTLFFADNAIEGHFAMPTIGPYDYWAIEYGYRPFDSTYKSAEKKDNGDKGKEQDKDKPETKPAEFKASAVVEVAVDIPNELLDKLPPEAREQIKKMMESGAAGAMMAGGAAPADAAETSSFAAPPSGEEAMLREIASRCVEPELAYATDQDSSWLSPDPLATRFDMGSSPIEWANSRIALVDKRMGNILEWAVKDQESWYHLRNSFTRLLFEKTMVLDYVGRFIGGQYFSYSHRGDANAPAPFELVDAKTQRQALDFIEGHLFADEFFTFSPELLNHLAPSRWSHRGTWVSRTMDFPIHRYIAILQWWNLGDRLAPNTLRRIHDAEMKTTDKDKLTVAEYLQRLRKACWADTCDSRRAKQGAWTDAKPFISSIRRSLQREYLGVMEPLVRIPPGGALSPDLHAMVKYTLQQLSGRLGEVLASEKLDFASKAHLSTCKSRIDRMLAPELEEYGMWWS